MPPYSTESVAQLSPFCWQRDRGFESQSGYPGLGLDHGIHRNKEDLPPSSPCPLWLTCCPIAASFRDADLLHQVDVASGRSGCWEHCLYHLMATEHCRALKPSRCRQGPQPCPIGLQTLGPLCRGPGSCTGHHLHLSRALYHPDSVHADGAVW